MIMRIWRTAIDARRVPEYIEFARRYSLPMFRRQPGSKASSLQLAIENEW